MARIAEEVIKGIKTGVSLLLAEHQGYQAKNRAKITSLAARPMETTRPA